MESFTLGNLIEYTKLGWSIFPIFGVKNGKCCCGNDDCNNQGKHPMTRNGFHNATSDISMITKWMAKYPKSINWAVATGAKSGIVVIDIDPRHGGDKSIKNFEIPDTLSASTGGGGTHYYFSYPGFKIKSNSGVIADGIDVRGDGGYVILPPSTHLKGKQYKWEKNFTPTFKLAGTPKWVYDSNLHTKKDDQSKHFIKEGTRNNRLTQIAGSERRKGVSQTEIELILLDVNQKWCKPPLSEKRQNAGL